MLGSTFNAKGDGVVIENWIYEHVCDENNEILDVSAHSIHLVTTKIHAHCMWHK